MIAPARNALASWSAAELEGLLAIYPSLSPADQAWVQRQLADVAPAPPPITFREYVERVAPNIVWFRFVEVLAARLQDVADGRITRLMVFAPPRSGKSTLVSQLFTGYFNYRYPMRHVRIAGYADDLASLHIRKAKAYQGALDSTWATPRDRDAVRMSLTMQGGSIAGSGVGGPITGFGMHLGVCDDPVKNQQEAASKVIQARNNDWWGQTWYTRLEPGGALVLVMTRWHPKDVSGFLLEQERAAVDGDPQGWHIVAFDAIRDPEPWDFPPSCTIEPDWRAPGEALNPERYPARYIRQQKRVLGEYGFSALFQQRPKAKTGNDFKSEWFKRLPAKPTDLKAIVRRWDLAGTDPMASGVQTDPDHTAGALIGLRRNDDVVVLRIDRCQRAPAGRNAFMKSVADRDRAEWGDVTQWVEIETGIDASARKAELAKALHGHTLKWRVPTGDKATRAEPFKSQAQSGNVYLLEATRADQEWILAMLDEFASFPFGSHDDQVDAVCDGYNILITEDLGSDPVGAEGFAAGNPYGEAETTPDYGLGSPSGY